MDFLYQESFTPWQTSNLEDKCLNYLRKPQEIFLKFPQRHNNTLHESKTKQKQFQLRSKDVTVSKQNKKYFIQRNKINSRCKPLKNQSKKQLKRSHQSLHFSHQTHKRSVNLTKQQQLTKLIKQPFHTLSNFAVKRKSLKQKIQKTKKLLEITENNRTSQLRENPKQDKLFQESLQRLLFLSKSHHNLNPQIPFNPSIIDSFFQLKNMIRSHNQTKISRSDLHSNKEQSKADFRIEKDVNFLQPKKNIVYIKKKGSSNTFYNQTKQQKIMDLPKIQILDWQKTKV